MKWGSVQKSMSGVDERGGKREEAEEVEGGDKPECRGWVVSPALYVALESQSRDWLVDI